jgi:hypothetical protein
MFLAGPFRAAPLMTSPNKPYTLTFETRPNYLYVRVASETISPQMVVDYLQEITYRCHRTGQTRLMVHRQIPQTLSETDIFFTGTEFAHMGIDRIKIAFVDERVENREHLEFAMLIANNRGANLKLFADINDAQKWLLRA